MRDEIIVAPGVAKACGALPARRRADVHYALETQLRYEPTKVSRSRIKRLRGLSRPQYRLRVGDIRVYYDVVATEVLVLAIVTKAEAQSWLERKGGGR